MTLHSKITFSTLILSTLAGLGACTSSGPTSQDIDAGEEALKQAENSEGGSGSPTVENLINEYTASSDSSGSSEDGSTAQAAVGSALDGDSSGGEAGGEVRRIRRSSSSYVGARTPRIAASPFKADGSDEWLNAFYFVRSDSESWESLSQTLYGRPDRSQKLNAWNKGKLKVGKVIYYNSPFRPSDSQNMKVFAEDFGIQLENVEVKAGDTLSGIAQSKYGSLHSWRELAALNPDLSNPDSLTVGQVLKIQPASIDTQRIIESFVSQVQTGSDTSQPAVQNNQTDPSSSGYSNTQAPVEVEPSLGTNNPDINASQAPPGGSPSKAPYIIGALLIISALIFLRLRKRRNEFEQFDQDGTVANFDRDGTHHQ